MKKKIFLIAVFLALGMTGCGSGFFDVSGAEATAQKTTAVRGDKTGADVKGINSGNKTFRLHILHINDTHSHLEPVRLRVCFNGVQTYVYAGGYARIARFIKEKKASDSHAIALHAGDAVQGTLYYTLFDGKADIDALNEMSLDAMTVGNHEFDKGADVFADKFADYADFPIVSCDINASGNKKLKNIIRPYIIKKIDGEKVAVVGDSIDSSVISNPGPSVKFSNYLDSAAEYVSKIEKKGINKIIFLTHIGYGNDKILAQQVRGIDVIVGGHSHTLLGDFSNLGLKAEGAYPSVVENNNSKTLIVSSWRWGEVVGDLNVVFDKNGKVISYSGTPVMLVGNEFLRKNSDGEKVEVNESVRNEIEKTIAVYPNIKIQNDDLGVDNIIARYKPDVDRLMNRVIGYAQSDLINVRLPGETDFETNTPLPYGSMVTPHVAFSMYEKAKEVGGCDFAVQNVGGVKISIPKGSVTIGEVYTLLPFGNTLVILKMKGKTVKTMLENAVERSLITKTNTGAFPYLAGAKITIDADAAPGKRIVEFKIKDFDGNWADLDENKIYTIATNSYVAGGGDYYTEMQNGSTDKVDTGYIDAEIFMEYVKEKKVLKPVSGED